MQTPHMRRGERVNKSRQESLFAYFRIWGEYHRKWEGMFETKLKDAGRFSGQQWRDKRASSDPSKEHSLQRSKGIDSRALPEN